MSDRNSKVSDRNSQISNRPKFKDFIPNVDYIKQSLFAQGIVAKSHFPGVQQHIF